MSRKNNKKIFSLTVTAIMASLAVITSFFEINIIPAVGYMKIDFSDFPAILTGLSFSPIYGILVELIKNIIHLTRTTTLGIGEIMNFIVGSGLVISMWGFTKLFAKILKEKRFSPKVYTIASIITVILTIIIGWIANIIFTPIYFRLMDLPLESAVYWAGVWGSTALNTVKGAFNVIPFYPLYLIGEKIVKKFVK